MDELKAQESEALDILEAMLDVCDLDNPGPMFAGQHVRGGICKIMDDDVAKLRQYIAARRAAPESKPLMNKLMPLTRANIKIKPLVSGSTGTEFQGIEKISDSMLEVMLNGPTVMGIKKGDFRGLARQLYEALQAQENRRAVQENKPMLLPDIKKKKYVYVEGYYLPDNKYCGDAEVLLRACIGYEHTVFDFSDYGKTWLAYARKPEESNPLMNELREKLNQLEAEVTAESGDAAETYTNGYIWGHRNGQIELLRRILKTDEDGTIKLEGSEKP